MNTALLVALMLPLRPVPTLRCLPALDALVIALPLGYLESESLVSQILTLLSTDAHLLGCHTAVPAARQTRGEIVTNYTCPQYVACRWQVV